MQFIDLAKTLKPLPALGDDSLWRTRSRTYSLASHEDDGRLDKLAIAVRSVARITGGNFRLLHRRFVQIERILKINGLTVIPDDVVKAARSTLVVGTAA